MRHHLGDVLPDAASKGIGLALVPTFVNPDAELGVDVRGRREIFQSIKPPFVDTSVRES